MKLTQKRPLFNYVQDDSNAVLHFFLPPDRCDECLDRPGFGVQQADRRARLQLPCLRHHAQRSRRRKLAQLRPPRRHGKSHRRPQIRSWRRPFLPQAALRHRSCLQTILLFNLLGTFQRAVGLTSYREPATLRTMMLTCGAILGRARRRIASHLSESWGGMKTHKSLLQSIFNGEIPTSPKFGPRACYMPLLRSTWTPPGASVGLNLGIQAESYHCYPAPRPGQERPDCPGNEQHSSFSSLQTTMHMGIFKIKLDDTQKTL